jgi:predicted nucleic acid-binding protein
MFLDTNYLIQSSRPSSVPNIRIRQWIAVGEPLYTSAVAWAEFCCGPLQANEAADCRKLLNGVTLLDEATAELAANLFNAAGRRARSLPDCLIAAAAITVGQPLATQNQADFTAFIPHGLVLA